MSHHLYEVQHGDGDKRETSAAVINRIRSLWQPPSRNIRQRFGLGSPRACVLPKVAV